MMVMVVSPAMGYYSSLVGPRSGVDAQQLGAQDGVVERQQTVQLLGGLRLGGEVHHGVDPLGLLLDLVGEPTPAPDIDIVDGASLNVPGLTGQVATPLLGTDAFQELDVFGMTMPIVKHSFLVRRVEDLPQLIDPRLTRAALSVKHDAAGDLHTAAVMDLKRGRDGPAKYPVHFPRPGSTVTPQALSQLEFPDALPGCSGYTHPAGAPIALLLGYGGITRTVELRVNGKPVETCLLTAQTFTGVDEGETGVGRSVLDAQGVAVAVPRRPLPASARVDVRFQTNSGPISWSFRTR